MGCSSSKSVVVPYPTPTPSPVPSGPWLVTPVVGSQPKKYRDVKVKETLVLEFTPPDQLKPYRVEEYFWEHKKKLIPDYGRMLVLDKRALQAPSSLKANPEELVDYLTKGLTSDLEKARVLMRWMGDNIQYDVEYLRTGIMGDYSVEAVLRTGRAVCQGYSDLLVHFCKQGNVNCETITGLSKGGSYYPGKVFDTSGNDPGGHAWNRVEIDGVWYLCDPTWAAGSTDSSSGKVVYNKKWKEAWFLTHPDAFLSTHLPFKTSKGVLKAEQLVKKPEESLEEWSGRVRSDPMAHAYNIQPISHPHSVIKTTSSELSIVFSNPFSSRMKQWVKLTTLRKGDQFRDRVMLYSIGNIVHVDVRLPGKGSYSLEICGKVMTPDWPNKDDDIPVHKLFWYKIDCGAAKPTDGFIPCGASAEWGMTPHWKAAGFQLISPENPLIKTKDGTCEIKIKLPIAGVVPTLHRLHHAQATTSDLQPCVYGEKAGSLVTYHIRCPYPGEYRFEIKYKPAPDAGNGGYYDGAAFLIQCQKPAVDAFCYADSRKLGGPLPEFHTRFGLRSAAQSSTLKSQDGEVALVIQKTRAVKLSGTLQLGNGQTKTKFKEKTSTDDATTFLIRPKENGFHFFKLYACEEGGEGRGLLVATYCVTT